ncbi:MAG: hypothetical protein NTZ78_13295 [Candidatus Aureabacteria bacterium]|nr:hypothetical protein [Candidatus Auribacterota bacterium]
MKKFMKFVLVLMFAGGLAGMAIAGSNEPSGPPTGGSGMYTLQNLYDYLMSGTALTVQTSFQEPASEPTAGTMKSTKQIGDDIKTMLERLNATTADNVELGKPFFCTQPGSWGIQTGTGLMQPTPTITPIPTITPTPTITWDCGNSITDSRDGKIYTTVQIGTQCWMRKNLNVGTMIPNSVDQTNNSTIEKYCYGNSETNCTSDGGIYQWNEMMQYVTNEGAQGICPDGWHAPTDEDWHTLENGQASGSCNPARIGTWDCAPAGTTLRPGGGSNFDLLYAGNRCGDTGDPSFNFRGERGLYWSSTEGDTGKAWFRQHQDDNTILRQQYVKPYGYPVRCIKN